MGPEWLVMAGVVGVLVSGIAAAFRGGSGRVVPHQDRAQAAWTAAAETLKADLDVGPAAALTPRRLGLRVDLDGARVALSTNVPIDPTVVGSTRAAARFALGAGPVFRLHPRGAGQGPGESALLGRPELAARYQLVADDVEAVAEAFDEASREALAAFPRGPHLVSNGKVVRLEWDGCENQPGALVAAAQLVGRLSLFGVETLRGFEAIEGAALVAGDHGPAVAVTRQHVTVLLQGSAAQGGTRYDARAEPERELPKLDVRIDAEGAIEGEIPGDLIGPEAASALRGVGEAQLMLSPKRVKLEWVGVPRLGQVDAGVTLVAALATGGRSQGAFR